MGACEEAVDLLLKEKRRCRPEWLEQRDERLGGNGTDFGSPSRVAIAGNRDDSAALELEGGA
jgi:hypothetical protein